MIEPIELYHADHEWLSHTALEHAATWDRGQPTWTPDLLRRYLAGGFPGLSSDAVRIGGIFHALMEGKAPVDCYRINPGLDMRTKEGKEWKSTLGVSPGPPWVDRDEAAMLLRMFKNTIDNQFVNAVMKDPTAIREESIRATHASGLKIKTRPDVNTTKLILDFKTTSNLAGWPESAAKYGYPRSAAQQQIVVEIAEGEILPVYYAVTSTNPEEGHACAVLQLDDQAMSEGRAQFNEVCRKVSEWLDFGWPEVSKVALPYWFFPRSDA